MSVPKKATVFFVLVLLAGVGAGGMWWLTHRAASAHHGAGQALYYCPMHPAYTADRPGNCPICGMQLVLRGHATYAGDAEPAGYASIMVTPQQQQLIGVKTAPVEQRAMTTTIRATGIVAHDPMLYQAQA